MQNSEKLCLKWKDFEGNIVSSLGQLKGNQDFTDVTLACEDGQQMEAHKFILASSSPFMMDILKRNKHSHPLIYMTGTNSKDLVAMLDFLYSGEANVDQQNLDTFLKLADELKLKGLTGLAESKDTEIEKLPVKFEDLTKPVEIKTDIAKHVQETPANEDHPVKLKDLTEPVETKTQILEHAQEPPASEDHPCPSCGKSFPTEYRMKRHIREVHNKERLYKCNECKKEFFKSSSLIRHKISLHGIYPESKGALTKNKIKATLDDVDGQVQSLMIMSEGVINSSKGSSKVKARICMLCGKEGQWNAIRDHIETNHIAGVTRPCKLCGKTFNSRNSLYIHVRQIHK